MAEPVQRIKPLLDPFEADIDSVKTSVDLVETYIDLVEAAVNLLESPVNLFEAVFDLSEASVDLRIDLLDPAVEAVQVFLRPALFHQLHDGMVADKTLRMARSLKSLCQGCIAKDAATQMRPS
ncbi:MAG TPA: hypothetical protein VFJ57_02885 [Solirubrobacterales bacterium]|nr:hypothetical protein [Solirubrobacterales bacterium]